MIEGIIETKRNLTGSIARRQTISGTVSRNSVSDSAADPVYHFCASAPYGASINRNLGRCKNFDDGDFTIQIRFKLDNLNAPDKNMIFIKGVGDFESGYGIGYRYDGSNSVFTLFIRHSKLNWFGFYQVDKSEVTNTVYDIALRVSDGQYHVFVNGNDATIEGMATIDNSYVDKTQNLLLGQSLFTYVSSACTYYSVLIYNRALTDEEIRQNYLFGLSL